MEEVCKVPWLTCIVLFFFRLIKDYKKILGRVGLNVLLTLSITYLC